MQHKGVALPNTPSGTYLPDWFSSSTSSSVKNYLLAIAINDYDHFPKLYNCVKDTQDLIGVLTEDFNFERNNVRFICSGRYDRAYDDVIIKPSAAEELAWTQMQLKSAIDRIRIWDSLDSSQSQDLIEILEELLEKLQGLGALDEAGNRKSLLQILRNTHLKNLEYASGSNT